MCVCGHTGELAPWLSHNHSVRLRLGLITHEMWLSLPFSSWGQDKLGPWGQKRQKSWAGCRGDTDHSPVLSLSCIGNEVERGNMVQWIGEGGRKKLFQVFLVWWRCLDFIPNPLRYYDGNLERDSIKVECKLQKINPASTGMVAHSMLLQESCLLCLLNGRKRQGTRWKVNPVEEYSFKQTRS